MVRQRYGTIGEAREIKIIRRGGSWVGRSRSEGAGESWQRKKSEGPTKRSGGASFAPPFGLGMADVARVPIVRIRGQSS